LASLVLVLAVKFDPHELLAYLFLMAHALYLAVVAGHMPHSLLFFKAVQASVPVTTRTVNVREIDDQKALGALKVLSILSLFLN
jgi:hypothetical protein